MAAGAFILGCAGPTLPEAEARFFREADPWGFILFARNVETPAQLRRLTADLREAVGRDAPILIDQEGGRVFRLGPPIWRGWPPPLHQATAAGDSGERAMWLRGRLIADDLRGAGVDVNCVPCADVARPDTHRFLRDRCLAETPDAVARLARAMAEGSLAGGVLPVLKHIPGHGLAQVDSHHALPRVDADAEELRDIDFAPFRDLADLPMGMTAHIVYDALDLEVPATTSAAAIAAIRAEIGFDGLLMTDDISMEALGGPVATRGARALDAGCDLVLHCNGDITEMAGIAQLGTMTDAAAARAEAALAARRAPDDTDLIAAADDLARLTGGHV